MEMSKTLSMSPDDFVALNYFFVRKRLLIAPTLFFALLSLLLLLFTRSMELMLQLVFIGGFALLSALLTLANLLVLKRAAKKQYLSTHALQSEYTLHIDTGGIRQTGEHGIHTALWLDIIKASETKSAFYLFFSHIEAFVIPKRLLNEGEELCLRALLNDNLIQRSKTTRKDVPSDEESDPKTA